jgi:hypothetical protein
MDLVTIKPPKFDSELPAEIIKNFTFHKNTKATPEINQNNSD